MVWSEQVGTSILVPSDRVNGDGRNYIVIGEDVPSAIADHFTAALVFRNGKTSGTDPQPGSNFDTTGIYGSLYPNGFVYYAFGISTAGALELVAFYFVVPSPRSEAYSAFRQTVLSIAPPTSVDSAPVVSIGENPNYGSYNEGSVKVLINDAGWSNLPLNVAYTPWDTGGNNCMSRINADGTVWVQGLAKTTAGYSLVNGATYPVGTLPVAPKYNFRRACYVINAGGNGYGFGVLFASANDTTLSFQNLTNVTVTAGFGITLDLSYAT